MKPAIGLIGSYLIITAILQIAGFAVSWLVDRVDPTLSLMTFVVLFLAMFWVAWPIAVRLSGAWFPDNKPDSGATA